LTNIAQLFTTYPEVAPHIKGLSIMGGSIGNSFTAAPLGTVDAKERIGNWSQWAEFNILVDPEAAQFLFQDPILNKKTTLIPLDVTHLVLATKDIQSLLLNGKEGTGTTTLRVMLVELLTFFAKTYAEVFGITEGPPLHDPLAVAVVLDGIQGVEIPFYDFVVGGKRERYAVHVVTEGSHEEAQAGAETGRTVATLLAEGEKGVKIPRGLDIGRFWSILEDCLERADEVNKTKGIL
jgi:uridine nucleosidase